MSDKANIQDGILLLRCQQGDEEAFADLVLRWQSRLWSHAYRLTSDREAAADVVQDSWLAVLKGLRRLEDVDAFPGWVFRIVTNKCADWVRKQQRSRNLTDRLEREPVRDAGASPVDGQRLDSLQTALQGLSLRQRALIILHYQEGFSVAEIAEILTIPEGTVKSRLYHARNGIRTRMEDTDHD